MRAEPAGNGGMVLSGKSAIVTGAGSGLGESYALALSQAGSAVMVADIDGSAAEKVAQQISDSGGKAQAFQLDVTDVDRATAMAEATYSAFGTLDILVNNAGWRPLPAGDHYQFPDELDPKSGTPKALEPKHWLRILEVNVVGPYICAEACRPLMAKSGGGAIVNQSSSAAYNAAGGPYGVSKVALNGVTLHLAEAYAGDNIRVNGIAPGMMTARMASPDAIKTIVDQQIVPRSGRPEDLTGALLFLCSPASSFISGQTILVDGGWIRRVL
jgi:3-oxoacyl-[acyl-carrier protein] reductase